MFVLPNVNPMKANANVTNNYKKKTRGGQIPYHEGSEFELQNSS